MQAKEKNWYPVYTHARSEKAAYSQLKRKGIETYLPLQKQQKQWSDRKKWIEEPLIKSYVFVHIDSREMAEVLMTKGISRFIYFSGKVAQMPQQQIDHLKLLMATADDLEITSENLSAGEKVIVKAGPLKGMRGEMIARRGTKKMMVKLEELSQSILITMPSALLDRV
ncbi:MAG: UpxY family transcription antiterminator [Mucilaginibacter polytrichastri]|nr:UpxY family transcription antiterminator [Mucilaginibacter polytrichastri]